MSIGNEIIASAEPRGRFIEGIISGTPKPGTVMQVKAATEMIGGRFTWEVYNVDSDGDQRLIAVLLPDQLQGRLATTAYVTGDRCFLYCPLPGEELNMLVLAAGTATSDALAIGDQLMVDDGTGILIAETGSPESEPFMALETVSDLVAAGALVHVVYTGH